MAGNLVEGCQLAGESIAVGDVHCLRFLESGEQFSCWHGVVPLTLKLRDDFMLQGDTLVTLCNVGLDLGQILFQRLAVHLPA